MGQTINPAGKEIIKVSTDWCGRELSLEINRVGFRTTSSVLVRYGETVVLGTAVVGKPLQGFDYFPLSIDYEEKFYAAGKVSGSRFNKREGKPSDDAVLIGRLIDRPIRPLWPKGYRNEVQVVATILSMDPTFRPDVVAMVAASTAIMLTGAPFDGPIAGLRIGINEKGEYQAFMSAEQLGASKLDIVVAGRADGKIMMVEAGANEATEAEVAGAIDFASEAIKPAAKLQQELVDKVKPAAQQYELTLPSEIIQAGVDKWIEGKLGAALRRPYAERKELVSDLKNQMHAELAEQIEGYDELKTKYDEAFQLAIHKDVRRGIVEEGIRPDGRKMTEVRPLSSEVGVLPRAHGSSIFTRGLTQGMNIVTLAPLSYKQLVDTMEKDEERRYIHHYNAPGYTVGEIKRMGSPGRREIGHGFLAERALLPMLPSEADFPYMIRSVTEIMSQNGSTSQAAVCSSCLALMDAGVPIKRPVSGIAMGLMVDGDKTYILTDIADAEDFAGDMDFKVAGSEKGITAMQMDMKVHGLKPETLKKALAQAKEGRAFILQHMLTTLAEPRKEMSPYAPRVETIKINPDKIREVIGKGGEVIQKITAETGTDIDIQDDGTVMIASPDKAKIDAAKQWIESITAEPEVGKIYENVPVVSVLDFGAFVQILPGKDGLVHVSEISEERTEKVSDKLHEGDRVTVKLVAIDDRGRLQLSIKAAARELKK